METIEDLVQQMEAVVSGAEAEDRSMSDEEIANYEALETRLGALRKDAEIRKRHNNYVKPITAPTVITARSNGDETLERAFEHYLRTGQRNMDLVELRAQGAEGADSIGGYLVPPGFRTKLTERMVAFGGIQTAAEILNTDSGNPIQWPTVDDTANNGAVVAEHAAVASGSDLAFGQVTLGAYKYMSAGAQVPLRVSVELLQDSAFDVSGFVSRALGTRIARAMATDFANGTGTGEPQGLNYRTPTVFLASGNPITYAKLLTTVHSVDPAYRNGAVWVMNDDSLRQVRTLEDNNNRPLWLPDGAGLAGNLPGGSLLGFPVIIDQAMPNIANNLGNAGQGSIAFGDIREGFIIRKVRDVQVVVDPYGRAANGEVQFTAWARADSKIQNSNAYVILAGEDVTP